ncbi:uncharacterized protein FOMMEDRAFT_171583 [Fomitiporia mediterranea MF3/22]|uniref:Uncharacterized protein n=1 Tax=Fomitiporia mediterranea (strain MF3/22) TaxID=694068 RepID=R7SJ55_FOMME|nr:uncharacterized protein FOMMEDRAFT_171583 [Fomitiporia mediterranea MF3/22]EJC97649.1 hypothetical protein FOMMEDRAFT_171583 [Fomitiporia mediterranea MF3/22]
MRRDEVISVHLVSSALSTIMARKTAGNSKGSSKQQAKSKASASDNQTARSTAVADDASSTTRASVNTPTTAPAPPPPQNANANANTGTNVGPTLTFRLLFLLIPLLQMLWSAEAPLRPFSAIRDRVTGELVGGSGELIVPRVMILLPGSGDSGGGDGWMRDVERVMPTIGLLSEEKRREYLGLWVVSLDPDEGKGEEGKGEEWGGESERAFWDVMGVEESRRARVPVDLSKLKAANWAPNGIAGAVLPFILENKIDTILTFDEHLSNDPYRTAVSRALTSLIDSPAIKAALSSHSSSPSSTSTSTDSKEESDSSAPPKSTKRLRVFHLLPSSPLTSHLGPLTPIIAHLSLALRTLLKNEKERIRGSTVFVSDVRGYVRSWKALLSLFKSKGLKGGEGVEGVVGAAVRVVGWVVKREIWVNEWVEV